MQLRRRYTPYLFLLPALVMVTIFLFYPILDTLRLSFSDFNLLKQPEYIGFSNYKDILNDTLFWLALKNSLLYLIAVVPVLVIIPIFIAILVNQQIKGIRFFRTLYYIPVVVSMVVVGIMWKWVYQSQGVLNYILNIFGLVDNGINWLSDPRIALFSVMAVTIWKGLGYYMVIYLAGLQSIPHNLYEAADIDGTNWWQRHIKITIPLLKPSILLVSILSSIAAMQVFTEIYVMTKGGPIDSTKTLVFYIFQKAFRDLNLGYAATMGFVLFVIIFILSFLNYKFIEED